MKICPKCRNEYRDGITHCADCGVELIEEGTQKQARKLLIEAPYPAVSNVMKYLEYCKFTSVSMEEPDEEGITALYCSEKEYKNAYKQMNVFLMEENKKAAMEAMANISEEDIQELEETKKEVPPSNVYVNYEAKASENKSSAWSFLIIGVLGVILVVLSWFNLIPFSIGGRGNWFTHGVMLLFFVIFIYIGIVSAKNINKYKILAGEEANTQGELEKFLTEQFTAEALEKIEADTEEEAYFNRMKFMREKVLQVFPEENEIFVESLLDAHYDKLFG